MHTWHWQTWRDLPYLTCSLLAPFPHGFFTQSFGSMSLAELGNVLSPTADVYRVRQVHGGTVLTPTEIGIRQSSPPDSADSVDSGPLPEADGILTDRIDQAVWVATADCVPALVADAVTGQVAAVHAGWRGTAAQILPEAIARLRSQGSQLHNLRIALGPAIAGTVYQVSTTVAAEVGKTVVSVAAPVGNSSGPKIDDELTTVLAQLEQLPTSPLLDDPLPKRVRIDIRLVNQLQLESLGICADHVAIAPYCTYQDAEHFFSYRRDRLKKVQWSGIVSTSSKIVS
ncbi:MAG TPA: peptidoglycan editing factor PgeF [Elainellaceae cyanobacterium]